jgi:predicted nucleic acid-binding protein
MRRLSGLRRLCNAASSWLRRITRKCIVALPRCKDRDDQKFLELARDTVKPTWLVTADKALAETGTARQACTASSAYVTPEAALLAV